jgi:hypothetical protein
MSVNDWVDKRRTREHVIADLSVNHVERYALLCGFIIEETQHDYGIDLRIATFTDTGEMEPGYIYIQLKATDRLRVLKDGNTVAFRVKRGDLALWAREPMPVILILYDAQADQAYWLYVQAWLRQSPLLLDRVGATVTVYFDGSHTIDRAAMRLFARYKADVLQQMREVIHEED